MRAAQSCAVPREQQHFGHSRVTASASEQALQRRKQERKNPLLDQPRTEGNYRPTGSLLNDNPGSNPNGNQHSA